MYICSTLFVLKLRSKMLISLLNIYLYVIPSIRLMNIYINVSKFGRVHGVCQITRELFQRGTLTFRYLLQMRCDWLTHRSLEWVKRDALTGYENVCLVNNSIKVK